MPPLSISLPPPSLPLSLLPLSPGQNEGSIRLINNGIVTLSTGRIQVWVDSQWGNVCGEKTTSLFSLEEGDVACRQLGYTGASSTSIESEDRYSNDANNVEIYSGTTKQISITHVLFRATLIMIVSLPLQLWC